MQEIDSIYFGKHFLHLTDNAVCWLLFILSYADPFYDSTFLTISLQNILNQNVSVLPNNPQVIFQSKGQP